MVVALSSIGGVFLLIWEALKLTTRPPPFRIASAVFYGAVLFRVYSAIEVRQGTLRSSALTKFDTLRLTTLERLHTDHLRYKTNSHSQQATRKLQNPPKRFASYCWLRCSGKIGFFPPTPYATFGLEVS